MTVVCPWRLTDNGSAEIPETLHCMAGAGFGTVKLDLAALEQEYGFSMRRSWLSRVFSRLSL